jgi:pimeloyl-ACP methyl ester carboxylesterase
VLPGRSNALALALVAAALALPTTAAGQGSPGDATLYCTPDGGPLGMASDAEHSVQLGEEPLPAGTRTSQVSIDGVVTRVVEAGPAGARDAIVFVHGNPGSARDFDALMTAGGEFARTVAFDMSGYGQSDKLAAQVQSTDGAAAYIGAVLAQLGVDRAVLVLHDFGGIWGLQWAAQNPDRLSAAVLMDAGVLIDYVPHPLAVVWATPISGELQMAGTTRANFRAVLQATNPRLPPDFVDRMYDNYDRSTRCAALRYYRSAGENLNIGREQAAVLRPYNRPALVIWGEDDVFIPPEQAEKQRDAFPDAEIHILEDSGHWPFVDNAERVRELFVPFVRPRLTVGRPAVGARRIRVPVQVDGVLPAYRVRARIGTRGSRARTVRGAARLTIRLPRRVRVGRHTVTVTARGLPAQRASL